MKVDRIRATCVDDRRDFVIILGPKLASVEFGNDGVSSNISLPNRHMREFWSREGDHIASGIRVPLPVHTHKTVDLDEVIVIQRSQIVENSLPSKRRD